MKASESKPEEILKKHCKNERDHWIGLTKEGALKAMQEYADLYHKEKLKNDLIHFASQRNEQHFLDWESKYMISVNEINDYLNTKE